MFDWLKIKTTLADARTECNKLRSTIATNKLRIEELRSLPPPREELAETVLDRMDKVADQYPGRLAKCLRSFIETPLKYNKDRIVPNGNVAGDIRVLTATQNELDRSSHFTIEAALFYLLRDQLRASVKHAVQEMEYPAIVGPAMPKRLAEIDKLTKENAGLEAKVKEMELEFAAISVDAVN